MRPRAGPYTVAARMLHRDIPALPAVPVLLLPLPLPPVPALAVLLAAAVVVILVVLLAAMVLLVLTRGPAARASGTSRSGPNV